MLVVLQAPVADGRRFINDKVHPQTRLKRPYWAASAGQAPDFLRSMGAIRDRPARGVDGWVNEDLICEANRWLRFDPMISRVVRVGDDPVGLHSPIFRRWISDGQFLSRLEVGWRVDLAGGPAAAAAKAEDFLTAFLSQPVRLDGAGEPAATVPLFRLPGRAHGAYRRISTAHDVDFSTVTPDLVRLGPALLYLELQPSEMPSWPGTPTPDRLPDDLKSDWDIAVLRRQLQGVAITCCFVRNRNEAPPPPGGSSRDLRVNLMRMHAEAHGLDFLHLWQQQGRLVPNGDVLYPKIKAHVEKLLVVLRPDRGALADRRGFRVARAALSEITRGRVDTLLEEFALAFEDPSERMLRTMRSLYPGIAPQLTMNTNNNSINAGDGATISVAQGAGNTGSVTATAHSVRETQRYQKAMEDLEKAVEAVAPKLEPRQAGRLQDKLEDLKQPGKKPEWYHVTAEGLKEAALALKDIAAPVATAAGVVISILLGT